MIKPTHIHTSGGVFTHHFIESLQQDRVGHPALRAETFTLPNYERYTEKSWESEIAETWEDLVQRWDAVEREFGALDISLLRRRWIVPLLRALGYVPEFNKADLVLEEDFRFPISHLGWAGTSDVHLPIHTLRYQGEKTLETKANPGRGIKAMAPHDMLQRYLNLSHEHRWALLCDGVYLRLLRDYYHTYTRGYTEFDLQGIFSARDFASFRAMFRLLHASRFVIPKDKEQAPIDELYEDALAMGVAVGKDLRENVQIAIETLGNGFLHSTPGLLDQLREQPDGAQVLFHEILVTIYRVLFLLFAEQRGMLPGRGSVYMEEFSLTAFRTRAERPRGDDSNLDLWEKLKTTFSMLEHGVDELKVYPYNGALFSLARTPLLTPPGQGEGPHCRNDALLRAIRHLTTVEKENVLQRISYADLSVEEIGSIYESLLEITPLISTAPLAVGERQIPSNTFFLDLRGMGRKTTGSYYTPPSLVNELIKSALEPVMLDRLQSAVPGYESEMVEALNPDERRLAEKALLKITVVDPASGSGAFLIAANNRLGLELARVRSGSLFPPEDDIRHARRDVLTHCIHGVDLNPMAVELCKVSLWINAAVEDAPLNFLDHRIQCGNSLVGATPEMVKAGIPDGAYNPVTGDDKTLATSLKRQNRQERDGQASLGLTVTVFTDQQTLKDWLRARDLAGSQPSAAERAFLNFQTSREYWRQRLPYDLWTAAFFAPLQMGQPIPTTDDVRQALANPEGVPMELRQLARHLAEAHRFFHWHLAFPEVFDRDGGFDVVLGNPPWERVKLQEKEFFAGKDEAIANAPNAAARKRLIRQLGQTNLELWHTYQFALYQAEAESNFLRNSEVYPLAGRGDINLYQVFAELGRHLIANKGRTGIIVPTGIATDYTCQYFFEDLVENHQITSLYDFENRKKLFPEVDSRMKFCLLTLRGFDEDTQQPAEFAFFLLTPEDLQDPEKTFSLTPEDFSLLNPNTRTCPIFRSRTDALLTKKLYRLSPVLINKEESTNPLNLSYGTMFDSMYHAHLILDDSYFNSEEYIFSGKRYVNLDKQEIFHPLFEGKSFMQFDHRFAEIIISETAKARPAQPKETTLENHEDPFYIPNARAWIKSSEINSWENQQQYNLNWYLVYKKITSSTNERTVLSTIAPRCALIDTVHILINNNKDTIQDFSNIVCLFNSFVFDFVARQKLGGTALSFYIIEQLPIISNYNSLISDIISISLLELTYTAWDMNPFASDIWNTLTPESKNSFIDTLQKNKQEYFNRFRSQNPPSWLNYLHNQGQSYEGFSYPPFLWDENRRFDLRTVLDALYGHLYNLTRDEFTYILETFPIVRRKDEAEYGEYRTKRVILEKFDAMADDPMLEGACIPLNERVSVLTNPPARSALRPQPRPKSAPVVGASATQPEPVTEKGQAEDQPSLLAGTPSDYTLYYCPLCDQRVLGFDRQNHTRERHAGVDPGYERRD